MTLNYVTLTIDLYDGQGNLFSGGMASFTPSATLTDVTDHQVIFEAPIQISLTGVGSAPTVQLLATDNSNVTPSSWKWNVSFYGISVAGTTPAYSFSLPYTSGADQYLSAVI